MITGSFSVGITRKGIVRIQSRLGIRSRERLKRLRPSAMPIIAERVMATSTSFVITPRLVTFFDPKLGRWVAADIEVAQVAATDSPDSWDELLCSIRNAVKRYETSRVRGSQTGLAG